MPCYNHGAFVEEAVASALAQDEPGLELIIVNDGSTDAATNRVLAGLSDPRLQVIQSENRGPAAARNLAITHALGTYILPLDADDRIAPDYARRAADVLDEQAQTGIVYGGAEFFGERTGTWRLAPFAVPEVLLENLVFNSMVFRRSDWERAGGYDEQMREGWEDWDFVLSLVALGVDVQCLPGTVYYHRVRAGSRDDSLDRAAHIRCYQRMFANHRDLYLANVDYLFGQIYDLRHLASGRKHLEHRIQSLKYQVAHLERVDEARRLQLAALKEHRAADARLAAAPLWRLALRRARAALGRKAAPSAPAAAPRVDYDTWFRDLYSDEAAVRERVTAGLARAATEAVGVVAAHPAAARLGASLAAQLYGNHKLLQAPEAVTGTDSAVLVFPDGDGELAPDALAALVGAMAENGADFVYADYGRLDTSGRYSDPQFLPDFSPDLLLAVNYAGGIFALSRDLLQRCGGLDAAPVGAARHDLVLRAAAQARVIYHLPRVIYHVPPGAQAHDANEAQVIADAVRRAGQEPLEVEKAQSPGLWVVRYRVDGAPRVSVLLTLDGSVEEVASGLPELAAATEYPALEIVLGVPEARYAELAGAAGGGPGVTVTVAGLAPGTSAAAAANVLAERATGEHLVLLGSHVRPDNRDWAWRMLEYSQRANVGAVGGLLRDEAGRVVHAGYVLGPGDGAVDRRPAAGDQSLQVAHNVIGVGADWLMIKRFVYLQLRGMDAGRLASGMQDVDLCLRLHETGFLNIFTPHALARAGARDRAWTPAAAGADREYFQARHHRILALGDPYYSRYLDRDRVDGSPLLRAGPQ